MAFVHATLEAVHAHNTSGIYCAISAKVRETLLPGVSSEAEDVPCELLYKFSCMTTSLPLAKHNFFHLRVDLY